MKIDSDLRMAINAAARAQKPLSYDERDAAEQKAVTAHLSKHKTVKAKGLALKKKLHAAEDVTHKIRKELNDLLAPLGVRFHDTSNRTDNKLELGYGEEAKKKFRDTGGQLPPKDRRKWTADEVIGRLATSKVEDRDAILAEYGIDWS